MKTEKLSLAGIKNVLSRSEMKNIMAGSGGAMCCWTGTNNCSSCSQGANSGNSTCQSGSTMAGC